MTELHLASILDVKFDAGAPCSQDEAIVIFRSSFSAYSILSVTSSPSLSLFGFTVSTDIDLLYLLLPI